MTQFYSIDNLVNVPLMRPRYWIGTDVLHHYDLPLDITYTENPTPKMTVEEYNRLPELGRTLYVPRHVQHHFSTVGTRGGRVIYVTGNYVHVEFEKRRMSIAPQSHGSFLLQCGQRTIIPAEVDVVIRAPPMAQYLVIPLSRYGFTHGVHMGDEHHFRATDLKRLTNPTMTNIDERRGIVDVTERVKVFSVADSSELKLGNHYHKKMREWYFLVSGAQQWDVDLRGERQSYSLKPKEMITVPCGVAHVVKPAPRTEFIGIIDRNFDSTDLHKFEF